MNRTTEFLIRNGLIQKGNTTLTMKRDNITYNINDLLEEFHKEQTIRFRFKTWIHAKVQQLADYINRD